MSSNAASAHTAEGAAQYLNPVRIILHLRQHRELILQLTRREISRRYRGSSLGIAWPFLQPLLLLAVYTLVFTGVFKARWPNLASEGTTSFAVVLFTGLVTFNIFSESVSAAPRLILANRSFVKRVVFPLEVLPVVRVMAALVQAVLGLGILLVGLPLLGFSPRWTALLLPMVWLPLTLFVLGLTFFLSSVGVFVRDIEQVIGVVVTALFFGSAIFYPIAQIPESARWFVEWLPTAVFVEDTRQLLLYGNVPLRPQSLATGGLALVTGVLGFVWFMKAKKAFSDVL